MIHPSYQEPLQGRYFHLSCPVYWKDMDWLQKPYLFPDLVPLYDAIYNKGDRSYFCGLEDQAERLAKEYSCPFVDNELPYGRAEPGHPVIVDYFYHEEVRGSENTGRRNPKK